MRLCMQRAIKETQMNNKMKLKAPLNLLSRFVLSTTEIFEGMGSLGSTFTQGSLRERVPNAIAM